MNDFRILDDFLPHPEAYRKAALESTFKTLNFETCTFHGIGEPSSPEVPVRLGRLFPGCNPMITFLRHSPAGQVEPHFIHTDIDMGKWSAILYLNPNPPEGDGTAFWRHEKTGSIGCMVPHERSEEGKSAFGWILRNLVQSKFNRLLLFPSDLFHSRAIRANWGQGETARLTQVTFGQGDIL